MGLFSSKSKSTSTTNVYDQSQNFALEFSGGELGGSADKNIVAGGNVTVTGLPEDIAGMLISGINNTTDKFVDGSVDLISQANKTTNTLIDGSLELVDSVLNQSNNLFNDTFKWIQNTIGSSQQQTAQVTSALANAYNSEQATHSAFKTYALYGLIGFIAWAYFGRK